MLYDSTAHLRLERLRLAAVLTHAVPRVGLELTPTRGTALVVSHDPNLSPDMNPCDFRRLVARMEASHGLIAEPGWLTEVGTFRLGGHDVTIGGSAVAIVNEADGRRITAFATTLDAEAVMTSARALARDLIDDDPAALEALRDVQLRVEHDPELRASAVLLPWSADEDVDDALLITDAIARRCSVDELLMAVFAR